MKNQTNISSDANKYRTAAEEQLKLLKTEREAPISEPDILKLIHELEVHQIELEMQNEELIVAKERAELAEEKYTELYDFAPSGYLSISTENAITDINFAASKMLGKNRSQLIGKRFELFVAVGHRQSLTSFLGKASSSQTKQTCEIMLSLGENLPIYVLLDCISNKSGDLCLLTMTDITDRKLAELSLLESNHKLEESESKFQQLVSNIEECFWLRDDDKVLYVSPGFEKIWGMPCSALYDNPQILTETIHPDDISAVNKILQSQHFKNTGIFNFDYRIIRADNKIRWINAKSFPVVNKDGVYFRRAGLAIDITENVQKKNELIRAKEQAEESDRLKSAFLANMSHEIRTPMNGILGFAHLLRQPDLSGDEQREYIDTIDNCGARMLHTINQIVDISKIEAGLVNINIEQLSINELMNFIFFSFEPETDAKEIELLVDNTLLAKDLIIETDKDKLIAILFNLVRNAIKFTKIGSIEFGCSLKTKRFGESLKNDEIEFYVKDTGIGIPKDRHSKIFDIFIQADIADKNAYQGSGLGLSISKAYIEMLGGQILLKSEEGSGSTFYFTVSSNSNDAKQNGFKLFEKMKPESEQIETKRLEINILIVEDDVPSSLYIKRVVKPISKKIWEVVSGVQSLEFCRNHSDIDLILMDIQLPGISGYEAISQIREFNSDVIIIAQTAYAMPGDKEKAIEAGANDYISKPINKTDLLTMIQKYFKN